MVSMLKVCSNDECMGNSPPKTALFYVHCPPHRRDSVLPLMPAVNCPHVDQEDRRRNDVVKSPSLSRVKEADGGLSDELQGRPSDLCLCWQPFVAIKLP